MFKQFGILLVLSISAVSSTSGFGQCSVKNTPNTVSDFNLQDYIGVWYENMRDVEVPFQKGECVTATYEFNEDGTIRVNNYQYDLEKKEGDNAIGRARCPNAPADAKCKVGFGPNWLGQLSEGNYWVVATDYKTYSIVYSCNEIFGIYFAEYCWVLTRDRNPSEETLKTIENEIANLGYPRERLRSTNQGNDCVYQNEA